jgi:hypothetical protein
MDKAPEDTKDTSASRAMRVKKPYRPPVLSKLGALQELTQNHSTSGKGDGGKAPFNKT